MLDLAAVQKYAFIAKQELEAVQVTGTDKITDETSVGYNWHLYGRLGLLLLSSFFEKHKQPWLDYKCHSLCAAITGYLLGPLESGVRKWVKTCMNEWFHGFLRTDKKTVFRRSMLVGLGADFTEMGEEEFSGHEIAIGMEIKAGDVWLYVFDYRMEEYVSNIHEKWFFQWMIDAVRCSYPYQFYENEGFKLNVREELVNLKERLHYGNDFMMCISIAWRVCMYMAFGKDVSCIQETDEDFQITTSNVKHHIFTMINYLYGQELVQNKTGAAIISPEMNELIFEINRETCYLMLTPFGNVYKGVARIYLQCMKSHAQSFIRYDLDNGVQITKP